MPKLKTLGLNYNQIGDEGVVALAEAVGKGALPKLKTLGLGDNQIGDEGVVALAEAVGKGALPKLEELNLVSNQIGDGRKGPRGSGWEGRAVGAQASRPPLQQGGYPPAGDGKGRVGGGQGQEERVVAAVVVERFPLKSYTATTTGLYAYPSLGCFTAHEMASGTAARRAR